MLSLLCVIAAYLIGSISFAIVASRIFRLPDPRSYGSGNPGATNVLRSGRKAAALLTLLGDAAKGLITILVARYLAPVLGLGLKNVDFGGMRSPPWAMASICGSGTGRSRTPACARPSRTAASM